jgi:type II secretory pathway pseudopilin PulG
MPDRRTHPCRKRPGQSGFSLLEVLFGGVILSIAFLGHAATSYSEHRLAGFETSRSEALHAVRQFMERVRSEDDFAGLYARLRTLQRAAALPGKDGARLADGRRAWPARAYFPEFVTNATVRELGILVDVPFTTLDGGATELREDADMPAFGLPADLNGDGVVEATARDLDYRALPVVVTFRWTPRGEAPEELRVATWLRSD